MSRLLLTHLLGLVLLYAAINTATDKQMSDPKNTRSEVDRSDISSLESRIESSRKSADKWKNVYIWLVGLAAVLGIAGIGAQYWSNKRERQLSDNQEQLLRLKDAELSENLKSKDLEIENTKAAASAADERAQKANEAAGRANEAAGKANERAAKLEKEAAEARHATEELRRANFEAAKNLEVEKNKRIALAVALLPRNFTDQSGAVVALQHLPNMSAIIEFADEREPLALAEQINFLLAGQLHWNVLGKPIAAAQFIGVGITVTVGGQRRLMDAMKAMDLNAMRSAEQELRETEAAGKALLAEFVKSGLEVNVGLQSEATRLAKTGSDVNTMLTPGPDLPLRTLLIRVGVRPDTVLERALRELGPEPEPTPIDSSDSKFRALRMGGNRLPFRQ